MSRTNGNCTVEWEPRSISLIFILCNVQYDNCCFPPLPPPLWCTYRLSGTETEKAFRNMRWKGNKATNLCLIELIKWNHRSGFRSVLMRNDSSLPFLFLPLVVAMVVVAFIVVYGMDYGTFILSAQVTPTLWCLNTSHCLPSSLAFYAFKIWLYWCIGIK